MPLRTNNPFLNAASYIFPELAGGAGGLMPQPPAGGRETRGFQDGPGYMMDRPSMDNFKEMIDRYLDFKKGAGRFGPDLESHYNIPLEGFKPYNDSGKVTPPRPDIEDGFVKKGWQLPNLLGDPNQFPPDMGNPSNWHDARWGFQGQGYGGSQGVFTDPMAPKPDNDNKRIRLVPPVEKAGFRMTGNNGGNPFGGGYDVYDPPTTPPAPANDNQRVRPVPAGFRLSGPGASASGYGGVAPSGVFGTGPYAPSANQNITHPYHRVPANQNVKVEPAGFRMTGPGAKASSGKTWGLPNTANDNPGGGKAKGLGANDNVPVVPFKAAYTPAQEALIEQGIDPNGPQAQAFARAKGGSVKAEVATAEPAPAPRSAKEVFLGSVVGAESGGNPNAKNPLSSATGLGQIITSTWAGLMKRHPELGLTPNGRTDRGQSLRAINALADEYEVTLNRGGIQLTPGAFYAAHFLGPDGAVGALRQPDGARMTDVVGPGVIKANPFLARMTVGDFKRWTEMKMVKHAGGATSRGQSHQSMPGAGASGVDTSGGAIRNFRPDNVAAEEERRKGGGGAQVQAEQASGSTGPQEAEPSFLPYIQEVERRRAAYKARRADRRSRIEEMLAMGDRR